MVIKMKNIQIKFFPKREKRRKGYVKHFIKRAISPKGGICFDMHLILILYVFFLCIALSIPFSQAFITNSNLNAMVKLVVEDVEFRGKVDGATTAFIDQKLVDFNLNGKNPTYSFSGNIRGDGKIQLQDEFVFEITVTDTLKFANFFDGGFSIDLPITKKVKGYSQNFYRDSEL